MRDKLKNSKYLTIAIWQFISPLAVTCFLLLVLFSCNSNKKESHEGHSHEMKSDSVKKKEQVYYCPMDPKVEQDKPGICPKCKMDLELKPASSRMDTFSLVLNPTNSTVLSTVKAIKPKVESIPVSVKAWGYVTYDTRRIATVSSRVGEGRVEKLYVKYGFQPIKKGQPLLKIFSHELLSAQKDYFTLKEMDSEDSTLIEAAKKKLVLLGMTESQINALKHDGHVHPTTTIYSPYTGYVAENIPEDISTNSMTTSLNTGSMNAGNNSMSNNSSMQGSNKDLILREGAYLNKGATIFKIVNTDVVWGIFEVYADQLPLIQLNQKVTIRIENTNQTIAGKVDFIEPNYQEGAKTSRFRVYLENKDQNLKIGNLLTGEIETGSVEGLWVPQSAVYDLGLNKIVFIKKGIAYEARKITIGTTARNFVEIKTGLNESDEIAENAQFMIDSEAFIKVKN